jgi:hypothetical protein
MDHYLMASGMVAEMFQDDIAVIGKYTRGFNLALQKVSCS